MGYLSSILIIPLLAILVLSLPLIKESYLKWIGLVGIIMQIIVFCKGALSYNWFSSSTDSVFGFQFEEFYSWLRLPMGDWGNLQIDFSLGVDTISYLLVGLSLLVFLVSYFQSWNQKKSPRTYFLLLMLLNFATIGCFTSTNFFFFYMFFEFMLLPMFFLIGIWGYEKREFAAYKFFIYTLLGSVMILLVIIAIGFSYVDLELTKTNILGSGLEGISSQNFSLFMDMGKVPKKLYVHSFEIGTLSNPMSLIKGSLLDTEGNSGGWTARHWGFLFMFLGFCIKLPSFPVHTWLPDAHVQAPTAISVILAGVLLKVGGYGIIRFCMGIFPDMCLYFCSFIALLGVISIVYGAFVAMSQADLKSMVAYSSISHMGFVLLGLGALNISGVMGAYLQMINHGIISVSLFLIVGVLQSRFNTRNISDLSGLWNKLPKLTLVVIITFFASLGLPGFNTFISEFFVFLGAFVSDHIPKSFAIISLLGIILGAAYFLIAFKKIFWGEYSIKTPLDSDPLDLNTSELVLFIPLCFLMVLLGVLPSIMINPLNHEIMKLVAHIINPG